MRRLTIAVFLLLAGCIPAGPDWDAMNRDANVVQDRCWERWERGYLHNFSEAIDCGTPEIRAIYVRYGNPYMDLFDAFRARWRAIAERFDRKEISRAEYDAQFAELVARINSEEHARNARATAANAPTRGPVVCNQVGFQTICW